MVLALLLIIFRGSNSEGQISIFHAFLSNYIEETAASVKKTNITQNQFADINSVFAYSGGLNTTRKPSSINTIQDNSVIARKTILTDLIDEFERGDQISIYEVQEGDTLSFVASDFGININTVIWANDLKNADDIKPGMSLKIPPVNGVVHKVKRGDTVESIAKKYGVDPEKITSFNSLPKSGDLQMDEELIVPDGKIQNLPSTSRSIGVAQIGTSARFASLPNLGDYFSWPAAGFDWGRIHGRNGIDLANACGTPIVAAANGNVTVAKGSGWNGGFGKYIKILHPNGTETLYAHASKLLASIGDFVTKGQEIALIGATGNSTGCHVHFEVHGARNPLAKN